MSESVGLSSSSRASVVEQILEQGQKLRNAMVKSILDSDPNYTDENSHRDKKKTMSAEFYDYCTCEVCYKYRKLGLHENSYQVPCLYLNERQKLLSSSGIGLSGSERGGVKNLPEEITKSIQDAYRSKTIEYLKYVNSLKITIHSLILNQAGNRKACCSSVKSKYMYPTSANYSYFVEYSVPNFLVNVQPKIGAKVDTGLSANLFRICSKKLQHQEIFFQHTSIHDIVNLLNLNSRDIDLKFQVSARTPKQQRTNVLGYATFNLTSFETTKHLCCSYSCPIVSDGLVMGSLKVTLQLGCGRMYFGKEFVEFIINNSKIDPMPTQRSDSQVTFIDTPSSRKVNSVVSLVKEVENVTPTVPLSESNKLPTKDKVLDVVLSNQSSWRGGVRPKRGSLTSTKDSNPVSSDVVKENVQTINLPSGAVNTKNDNILLYGLLYISEVRYYDEPINTYLSCQVFGQNENLCSRIIYNSKHPVFNFHQKVPFLYDDEFLNCMQNNSIVVEVWERKDLDEVAVGIVELPLYQFYVSYKNKEIAETLFQSELPVVTTDGWETFCNPNDGILDGQMKVLVAIGTPNQIHNLEVKKGLKDSSNTVTYIPVETNTEKIKEPQKETTKKPIVSKAQTQRSIKRPPYLTKTVKKSKPIVAPVAQKPIVSPTVIHKTQPKATSSNRTSSEIVTNKVDVGVQADMDTRNNQGSKVHSMLESFLGQLVEQKKQNTIVESATNTEQTSTLVTDDQLNQSKDETNTQMRKTSDLLDSLSNALSLSDTKSTFQTPNNDALFKAHVIVEGALHLPSKRRSRSKRVRRRNVPFEETQPSTYVTFETCPGADLKVTPIVAKTTSPQWDFRCDVFLPGETLTNNQKRFIFKVWRKSNNGSPNPNMQTDIVLGFAALDLTVLLAGLPGVQGWFNIVDFTGKCNGQIKIHVTPLENISRFNEPSKPPKSTLSQNYTSKASLCSTNKIEVREESSESLGRALKRKFTELEEITQRLRSRLADVTKDDSDTSNDDELSNQFENDINNLCVEEDYNMIDFSQPNNHQSLPYQSLLQEVAFNKNSTPLQQFVSKSSNDSAYCSTRADLVKETTESSCSSESQILIDTPNNLTNEDRQLLAGKQHIDTLLEKLSLLTGADDCFSNRYVSGCSLSNRSEVNKNVSKDDNLNLDEILNSSLFNQLCGGGNLNEASQSVEVSECSSNSSMDKFVNYRLAPEGAGNVGSFGNSSDKNV